MLQQDQFVKFAILAVIAVLLIVTSWQKQTTYIRKSTSSLNLSPEKEEEISNKRLEVKFKDNIQNDNTAFKHNSKKKFTKKSQTIQKYKNLFGNMPDSEVDSYKSNQDIYMDSLRKRHLGNKDQKNLDILDVDMVDYAIREENIGGGDDSQDMPICEEVNFPPGWPYASNRDVVREDQDQDITSSLESYKLNSINFWKTYLTRTYLLNLFKNTNFSKKSGIWSPKNCQAKSKLAIIIPFRSISNNTEIGRETELTFYLYKMIVFLQFQKVQFKIYVIDQDWSDDFNRARLMNIGFLEAERDFRKGFWDCYLFTDVDKFPINLNLSMHCNNNKQPVHYLPFLGSYGGVAQFPPETIYAINGFSNQYFGWGGEDQDIAYRMGEANIIFKEVFREKLKNFGKIGNNGLLQRYFNMSPFIKSKKGKHILNHPFDDPKLNFFLETGHRGKGSDVGNAISLERKQLLENFKSRLAYDGLNNLNYKLLKIDLEENFYIFSRYKVSFSREEDSNVNSSSRQEINWKESVLNHKCLESLADLRNCYINKS